MYKLHTFSWRHLVIILIWCGLFCGKCEEMKREKDWNLEDSRDFWEGEEGAQVKESNEVLSDQRDEATEGELFLPGKKCRCGVSQNPHRIINGSESALGAWPWMAAIVVVLRDNSDGTSNKYGGFCGGSIINDKYILTAAHCVEYMQKVGVRSFKVILGDTDINGIASSTRQVFDIDRVRKHPKYDNISVTYDVGLIKLTRKITFNENILPVCLGQAGSPFPNKFATVAGWGLILGGDSTSASNSLRQTTIQVLTNTECVRIFNGDPDYYPSTMICTIGKGTNACNGDSGGPLVIARVSSPSIYKQIGIVSYGIDMCRQKYPTVYTRVKRVLSWIKAFTKDGTYCSNSFVP